MKPLVFFHGLEGSATGRKATYLRGLYPSLVAPELPRDLDQRLEIAKAQVKGPSVVVGSSWGGLTALMLAQACPERVSALLLLAPALGFLDESRVERPTLERIKQLRLVPGVPCEVLAAAQDELIDPKALQAWVQQAPEPDLVHLEFVPDNHSLGNQLERIAQKIRPFMES